MKARGVIVADARDGAELETLYLLEVYKRISHVDSRVPTLWYLFNNNEKRAGNNDQSRYAEE
ncbi:hypothetical protein C5S30_01960 [ANME-1 cluster archaeon GoMg4]|nr:hypothetical protein [ANME-1 cluster archaeon GoMg4]